MLGAINGDPPGHLGRAQGCEYLAYAYVALAKSTKTSASEARKFTIIARTMFQKAVNILNDLRSRQCDLGANEQWARELAGEIAKGDTALEK